MTKVETTKGWVHINMNYKQFCRMLKESPNSEKYIEAEKYVFNDSSVKPTMLTKAHIVRVEPGETVK